MFKLGRYTGACAKSDHYVRHGSTKLAVRRSTSRGQHNSINSKALNVPLSSAIQLSHSWKISAPLEGSLPPSSGSH